MQLSLPAMQKILDHSSTNTTKSLTALRSKSKKQKKNKKNHAVSRLGNFGVEDDNSWEKKVFFECNKKKTAMNKQKFLKFTWRSLNITLAGRYHGEVSPFALLSCLAVSFRINLYQTVKFKRKTPWDSPPPSPATAIQNAFFHLTSIKIEGQWRTPAD